MRRKASRSPASTASTICGHRSLPRVRVRRALARPWSGPLLAAVAAPGRWTTRVPVRRPPSSRAGPAPIAGRRSRLGGLEVGGQSSDRTSRHRRCRAGVGVVVVRRRHRRRRRHRAVVVVVVVGCVIAAVVVNRRRRRPGRRSSSPRRPWVAVSSWVCVVTAASSVSAVAVGSSVSSAVGLVGRARTSPRPRSSRLGGRPWSCLGGVAGRLCRGRAAVADERRRGERRAGDEEQGDRRGAAVRRSV